MEIIFSLLVVIFVMSFSFIKGALFVSSQQALFVTGVVVIHCAMVLFVGDFLRRRKASLARQHDRDTIALAYSGVMMLIVISSVVELFAFDLWLFRFWNNSWLPVWFNVETSEIILIFPGLGIIILFLVATVRIIKNKNKREKYSQIIFFLWDDGPVAELIRQYLIVGARIFVISQNKEASDPVARLCSDKVSVRIIQARSFLTGVRKAIKMIDGKSIIESICLVALERNHDVLHFAECFAMSENKRQRRSEKDKIRASFFSLSGKLPQKIEQKKVDGPKTIFGAVRPVEICSPDSFVQNNGNGTSPVTTNIQNQIIFNFNFCDGSGSDSVNDGLTKLAMYEPGKNNSGHQDQSRFF